MKKTRELSPDIHQFENHHSEENQYQIQLETPNMIKAKPLYTNNFLIKKDSEDIELQDDSQRLK